MNTKTIEFDGLQAVEILTARLRMVVVTQLGPRIAFLGRPDGENLFYWRNDDLGREGWRLLGGHRVWVTRPGADEAEEAYAADNDPCDFQEQNGELTVTGALHPVYKTRRGVRIRVLDADTFQVTSFLTNAGPMLTSGGVWSPTCINPAGGKQFAIPLGDRRLSWDLIKLVIPRAFAGHTSLVNDPQISFNEEFILFNPQGVEAKRMLMAPMGIIAMSWPQAGLSFLKRAPYNPRGRYPLDCNLAVYIGPDNYMVEMETYGEEQTLIPGATSEHVETWKVVDQLFDWQDSEELRAMF